MRERRGALLTVTAARLLAAILVLVASLLVVWAVSAGSYTVYFPQAYRQPTLTPTATATPTPTPTLIPGHYYLSGRVFFDYNGSGLQEEGEPGIQGVPVYVDSLGSALHATTAADGSYSIPNVPPGAHQVYVQSPTQEPATAFRYINLFKRWADIPAYEMNGVQVPAQHLPDTAIMPIDQPLAVSVGPATRLDVSLMQGFLTLPFAEDHWNLISRVLYFDHDPRVGYVSDYRGDTTLCSFAPTCPAGTCDGHVGIDYACPIGTPLIANTPGRVETWVNEAGNGSINLRLKPGLYIDGGEEFETVYSHLSVLLVETGQVIHRGQIVGLSGASGTEWSHFHFDVHFGPTSPREPDDYMPAGRWKDPFGVTDLVPVNFPVERYSSWTRSNLPQFPIVLLTAPLTPVPTRPRTPTPTRTLQPTPVVPIVIDGRADDWAAIDPLLEDGQGDSRAGSDTDLKAAYAALDENFVYLMIRAVDSLTSEQATIELNLDLRQGNLCGHNYELHTNISSNNALAAWTDDPCGTLRQVSVPDAIVRWGDVLEMRMSRSSLSSPEFARPIFAALWTNFNGTWDYVDTMP